LRRYGDLKWRQSASWIFEIQIFNGLDGYGTHFASSCQVSRRSVSPFPRYGDFCDYQDGGGCHLRFSKIRNFNGLSPVGANLRHLARFHQNPSNSGGVAQW